MKPSHQPITFCPLRVVLGFLILASCQSEPDLDANNGSGGNNGSGNNPVSVFTADELAGFLVLDDASKITGDLPTAPDNHLKINIKDTLYIANGFPIGERIVIRHDKLYDISGFYIAVENSSFYYDVPVVGAEAQDSTDVFYINFGETLGIDWELPFPLLILPHGPDGLPWDEFFKIMKIEAPGKDAEDITVPTSFSLDLVHWEWMYTVKIDPSKVDPSDLEGNVLHFEAKGLKKISAYQTGGCCNDDGISTTVANDPYCFGKFSNGTPNPKWRTLDVEHFFMWAYDVLYLYDDGTFRQANTSVQTNYRPSLSDFCNGKAVYDFDINTFVKFGTHDFTPGADHIKFTYNITDPPVFGKNIYGGELLYSSHNMLISFGNESEKWYFKYQRPSDGVSVTELTLGGWD